MKAIVTKSMSKILAENLLDNIQNSSDEYYIGIGKSDVFDNDSDSPIFPVNSLTEEKEFRNNLQSIKKIEVVNSTLVVKRVNWSSGTIYSGWDNSIPHSTITPPCYVLTDSKDVYICLESGKDSDGVSVPSMIEPHFENLNFPYEQPFSTSDGYTWKFLFSLSTEQIRNILSSNHFPVQEHATSTGGSDIEDRQFAVREASIGGQIISAFVDNGGSGYSTVPTLTVEGDGSEAEATAHIKNGQIVRVEMTNYGKDYVNANIKVTSDVGSDAVIRPIITSSDGIGFSPIEDLKSSSVLMSIKPNGTENDTFIVENYFRQIGVIKNPLTPEGNLYTGMSTKTLSSLTLTGSSPFEVGKKIIGETSKAEAFVDESEGNMISYHQNSFTGFQSFQDSENITQSGVVGIGEISSISPVNGIDKFSGDVLYVENRSKIRRDLEQQEDIKVVITL